MAANALGQVAYTNYPLRLDNYPHQVSGEWLVDIRTVISVGAIVLAGAVWISRVFQRFIDRLNAGNIRFNQIEEWMAAVDKKLNNMPCKTYTECRVPPHPVISPKENEKLDYGND